MEQAPGKSPSSPASVAPLPTSTSTKGAPHTASLYGTHARAHRGFVSFNRYCATCVQRRDHKIRSVVRTYAYKQAFALLAHVALFSVLPRLAVPSNWDDLLSLITAAL